MICRYEGAGQLGMGIIMARAFIFMVFGLPALVACAQFPDLDVTSGEFGPNTRFPTLIPIDPLLLSAANQTKDAEEQTRVFAARVAQLRARARAMQRPIIDQRTRRSLAAALDRHIQ